MNRNFNLQTIKALVIDVDGTLWRGSRPLPGLAPFFNFLQRRGIAFTIVTNNSAHTPRQYHQKLAGFGVNIHPGHILTCSRATAEYLQQTQPGATLYVIGQAALRQTLRRAGFRLTGPTGPSADVVVVGGDTTLTYDKLKQAVLFIQQGARFIGTNPDLLVPTEEGLVPEAGTTLAAIQAATGVSPTIIGKPERLLFDMALKQMKSAAAQTAMLGDRLETDILGGQKAGLKTILVTTGIDNRETIRQKNIYPNAVFGTLAELTAAWQRGSK